jgi:hypothetical protein
MKIIKIIRMNIKEVVMDEEIAGGDEIKIIIKIVG